MNCIYSLASLLLFVGIVKSQQCTGDFTLPQFYFNGMVFQSAPNNPEIWGFTNDPTCTVEVTQSCNSFKGESHFESQIIKQNDPSIWSATITGYENNVRCTLNITQGDKSQTLDIIFGDVYICSGQSNMERRMDQIYNSTEEIAASASYTNIKMFLVNHAYSDTAQEDLLNGGWDNWYGPDNSGQLSAFSAVCFLYARELTDVMGPDYAIGLIESNWGGTRIEAWSSQDALDSCNVPPNVDNANPQQSNSYLWNAMIHPLLRHTVYGGLWYQGEANRNWNKDLYNCTFPGMITDWRAKWSNIDPVFPFGFVQLANNVGDGVESIRWHQTADSGYVPNTNNMEQTFMAVAMDTYDEAQGIHPRNKQIVAERLNIAGLNVAYGMTQYPTNGPFPQTMSLSSNSADITYDQSFTYNSAELSGFYFCPIPYNDCDNIAGSWNKIDTSRVTYTQNENRIEIDLSGLNPMGLAYLWEDTPTKINFGLPIYADDAYNLPGGPWKAQVQ